jgi:DHA1 family tetracycline resistance protein-like MFS transporter
MKSSTRAFGLIFLTLLIDVAAMGMSIPVLPSIISGFVGGDLARAAQLAGLIAALAAGLEFVFAPIMGALSDRYGRKPALVLGMLGPGLMYLLLAMAAGVAWLFVGYLIAGILGAIYATANAYLADITPAEQRASRYGLMGAAFGLGFIVGPLAGGLLGGIGLRLPLYAAGGLTLLNLALCLAFLPESLPSSRRRAFRWSSANPLGALGLLRRNGTLLALAASLFLSNVALNGLYSTWIFSTTMRFGWGTAQTGVTFAVMGLLAALVQSLLVGPAVRRLGERCSILIGLSVSVFSFLAYALAPQGWMIYLIIAVSSLGALDAPATQTLVAASVDEDERGAVQGALTSILSVTRIVGPLIGTNIFAYFVSPSAPIFFPGAPFAVGAMLIAGALLLAWRFVRPAASATKPALAASEPAHRDLGAIAMEVAAS